VVTIIASLTSKKNLNESWVSAWINCKSLPAVKQPPRYPHGLDNLIQVVPTCFTGLIFIMVHCWLVGGFNNLEKYESQWEG
jgi:hypothetical protein